MNPWPTKKLGEVCEIMSPGIKEFEGSKKYVATADVDFDKILYFTKITYKNRPSRANMEVKENDVLVARMAETKKFLIADKNFQDNYIFSTGFVVLRVKDELIPRYLFYFLTTKDFNLQKDKLAVGATQKAINNPALKKIKIPLPPLKIQQKIVERLDTIKKAQELNDKQIELAEELFQSLLHRELDPKGKNWEVKKLGEVASFQYGYTESAKEKGNFRFIRITDIGDNGELINLDKKYIQADEKELIPYILEKSDLLIARTGATFGKMLYFDSIEPSVFASYLIRVKPNKNIIIPKFIWLFSRTSDYWRQAWNLMTGSGQQQFNANKIKQIKIPLPPLETQKKIVEKLSAVQEYKKKLLDQKQKLQELFDSVLNKSFNEESLE